MRSRDYILCCLGLLTAIPVWGDQHGHEHPHDHGPTTAVQGDVEPANKEGREESVSGQKYKFRVLYDKTHLPAKAQAVLARAHGGFAVDRRPGNGETYFALPGAGIIRISADFSSTTLLDTAPAVRDHNQHNTTIWSDGSGTTYLTFPGNSSAAVHTTDLNGKLLHTLGKPTAESFDEPTVRKYFEGGGRFVPTDVEYHDGRYYVTTGYSPLDYVLTAGLTAGQPFNAVWGGLVFGGKGGKPGQFGTGHGITVTPDQQIAVADRPHSEIDYFTPEGEHQRVLSLPKGSFPCDTDMVGDLVLVGCLHGPDRSKGAPIYIVEGDEVVSTVMCREELGLANFTHIHNAVMRKVKDRLYIIAQAWNPGDFVILEQVK